MVGDESADKIAPIITTIQELGKLVEPVGLSILPDFEDGIRRVGLIFNLYRLKGLQLIRKCHMIRWKIDLLNG